MNNIEENEMDEQYEEQIYNYADKNEAFQLIIDLGDDYDGFNNVISLKALIDELVEIARIGIKLGE
jgi:hypothetical protein